MSLDKAGTLRYNLKYKRRRSAKSGRSSDRFYVEKKAASLQGARLVYFFMYPRIPKTIVAINCKSPKTSIVDIAITSLLIEGGTTFFHRLHFDYSMCVILCQSTVFSDGFYFFAARDGRIYPSFFCHKMQKTALKGGLLTDFDFICYHRDGQVHIAVRPSVPFPLSAAGRRWRECGKRHFSFSYVQ